MYYKIGWSPSRCPRLKCNPSQCNSSKSIQRVAIFLLRYLCQHRVLSSLSLSVVSLELPNENLHFLIRHDLRNTFVSAWAPSHNFPTSSGTARPSTSCLLYPTCNRSPGWHVRNESTYPQHVFNNILIHLPNLHTLRICVRINVHCNILHLIENAHLPSLSSFSYLTPFRAAQFPSILRTHADTIQHFHAGFHDYLMGEGHQQYIPFLTQLRTATLNASLAHNRLLSAYPNLTVIVIDKLSDHHALRPIHAMAAIHDLKAFSESITDDFSTCFPCFNFNKVAGLSRPYLLHRPMGLYVHPRPLLHLKPVVPIRSQVGR